MILLIDNYDSFVHNLARYFERLGHATKVVRNDAIDVAGIRQLAPDALVLSPGPCTPREAGCSLEVVRTLRNELPILGICLGHQAIAAAFGAEIVRAVEPMHGRTSLVQHHSRGLFAHLPNPITACRYHSLVIDEASLSDEFRIDARSTDQTIMAIRHRDLPMFGVQFHPESILTDCGYDILAAFLKQAGMAPTDTAHVPEFEEFTKPVEPALALPDQPVTF